MSYSGKNAHFYFAPSKVEEIKADDSTHPPANCKDWGAALQSYFNRLTSESGKCNFFVSSVSSGVLWETFLDNLPSSRSRREHSCDKCEQFFRAIGRCVTSKQNKLVSVIWPGEEDPEFKLIPPLYHAPTVAIKKLVEEGAIERLINLKRGDQFGAKFSGGWRHLYIEVKHDIGSSSRDFEVKENYGMLKRCYEAVSLSRVVQTQQWFADDNFPGRFAVLPKIEWLRKILEEIEVDSEQTETILWKYAANSPLGFLHSLRSGMASILLNPEEPGIEINDEERKQRYKESIDPHVYRRRVAPPKEGNVEAAQKFFDERKITDQDKQRYYCKLSDIPINRRVWETKSVESTFGDKPVSKPGTVQATAPTMSQVLEKAISKTLTFTQFLKEVVPKATRIEYLVPSQVDFYAFVTGAPNTYPFCRWHTRADVDKKIEENLVSWYTYPDWQKPIQCGLTLGEWTCVQIICPFPDKWKPQVDEHSAQNYLLVLPKSYDTRITTSCLFPSYLHKDFAPFISTIEQYNRSATVLGRDHQEVCGVHYGEESKYQLTLRVELDSGKIKEFIIERYV